jgi:hypothetical protein
MTNILKLYLVLCSFVYLIIIDQNNIKTTVLILYINSQKKEMNFIEKVIR